jgi:hypothetical protein
MFSSELLADDFRVTSQREWHHYEGRDSVSLGVRRSEGFCYLTMVSGKFEGAGEEVRIFIEDGAWRLGGKSRQKDLDAGARCVKWDPERPLPVTKEFGWRQGRRSTRVGLEEGEGFCYLTRLGGDFEGAGERVEVQRNAGYWELGGRSRQDGIAAGMRCVQWPRTARSSWYEHYWAQRRADPVSLPVREAEGFCYLSMVQGKFEGGGEEVLVYASRGRWQLGGQSRQEGVAAAARCVEFD